MNRAGGSSYKNTAERQWLAQRVAVICSHWGGPECEDCKFNHVTYVLNSDLGKRFFCQNAMNDMSGAIVTLDRP